MAKVTLLALTLAALTALSGAPPDAGAADETTLAHAVDAGRLEDWTRGVVEAGRPFDGRLAGGPGEAAARAWVADAFRDLGYAPEERIFAFTRWAPVSGTVTLLAPGADPVVLESRLLTGSGSTLPGAPVTARVVDVGHGSLEDYALLDPVDLQGTVHLASNGYVNETDRIRAYTNAVHNGAAGFLFAHTLDEPGLMEAGFVSFPLSAGPANAPDFGAGVPATGIPAFAVTAGSAARVRDAIAETGGVHARLESAVRTTREASANVVATLPGTDPDAGRVIVGAHVDNVVYPTGAFWEGAEDNALGTGALLELARVARAHAPFPRTIEFVAFGAEEAGLAGSIAHVLAITDPLDVALVVNLDSMGPEDARILVVNAYPRDLATRFLALDKGFTAAAGLAPYVPERVDYTSDHYPFAVFGIPSVWTRGQVHAHLHSEFDTIDHLDFGQAAHVLRLNAALVEAAANGETFPRPLPGLHHATGP